MSAPEVHPTLSVVVPAYNEELCLPLFYEKVAAQLEEMQISWEILFINDGSRDRTLEVAKELHARDARVKVVHFSRNFGNQVAISAGLDAADGDAVVVMDADLQQPPELLPAMVRLWREEGFYIVHAVRTEYNKKAGWVKRASSAFFYRLINRMSDVQLIPGASEFRLLDRRVVNEVKHIHERSRFLRALFQWVGFRSTTVTFQANDRSAGTSSFSSFKLMKLALDGIVSFSTKPLRWIMYLGFFAAFACVPYALWAIGGFLIHGQSNAPGWASLIVSNIFFGGVQLISIGVIGEYVGRIYTEVKARPLYVIQERYGFGEDDQTGNSAKKTPTEPVNEPDESASGTMEEVLDSPEVLPQPEVMESPSASAEPIQPEPVETPDVQEVPPQPEPMETPSVPEEPRDDSAEASS